MKHLEVLRAELERIFELEELVELSRDILGFDPEQIGGTAALGSFAGALVTYCQQTDSVVALADALKALGKTLSPALAQLSSTEPVQDTILSPGTDVGAYHVTRKLGEGRLGATYLAKSDGKDVRLKILHPETTAGRRGLNRFLTLTRLTHRLNVEGIPALVYAGTIGDRVAVAHAYQEGQPLAARVARTGPMHINEARPILKGVLSVLEGLHARSLAHGALSLENVISFRAGGGEPKVTLLDPGTDRLRVRPEVNSRSLTRTGGNPKTIAPEQITGGDATAASDLYGFGALAFELLTGKPLFDGDDLDLAIGHLQKAAPTPSAVAPRGWITPDLDDFILGLLNKEPGRRGQLSELTIQLDDLGRKKKSETVNDEQIDELEQALLQEPGSAEAQMNLEAVVGRGGSHERIAEAFQLAASMIEDPIAVEERKVLLIRAARLFEQNQSSLSQAADVYTELVQLDPRDGVALAGLEEVYRRSEQYEELLEMLLLRAEAAESQVQRARLMGEIGKVYLQDLEDREQATVAYSQAFVDDPIEEYAHEVERAAGSEEPYWAEALSAVGEATQEEGISEEKRTALMLKAGVWYREKVLRGDLALPCFQAVLGIEPSNETALLGLTEIYRKAQQWQELGMMLSHRADAAATPIDARNLRTEAGELLEDRIGDLAGARTVYETVLNDDPTHTKAAAGLARVLEKTGDHDALVKILKARVADEAPASATLTLCQIGEIYEDHLNDDREASQAYEKAFSLDLQNLDALRGLERVFTKAGKYQELLENLGQQVEIAVTPKQKIVLLERIAAVNEEEFLNHEAAAEALEKALECDSGRIAAMTSLIRHLRVLERWDEASKLYERQLELAEEPAERISLAMAWGRLLADQIGSPERAVHAYEIAIDVDPDHQGALEALAKLREAVGDAERALEAIVSLAEQAEDSDLKSDHYVRAAKLAESAGDRDAAIEFFKHALDSSPENRNIAAELRTAYVARGDINAAVELIERELDIVEGDLAQAKLAGEMARLQRERLKDDDGAESSAQRALRLDPSNADALLVLGDLTFEQNRFHEASAYYGRIADRVETMGEGVAVPVLERFVDALSKSGSTEIALKAMDVLLRLAPDDAGALRRVAFVTFEHGAPKRAAELLADYLQKFGDSLSDHEKAEAFYRQGAALRKAGDSKTAIKLLDEASELAPNMAAPVEELAKAYIDLNDYKNVIAAKTQHLDIAEGDKRGDLLIEIGELYADKLNDRTAAARSFVAALDERPEDRKLLSKLMQLYSQEKDWNKLVEVVVKLAEFVDDDQQRVKYLHTAALVSARELGDVSLAIDYFEQVLDLDPDNKTALAELVEMQRNNSNYSAVEDLLKQQLMQAQNPDNIPAQIAIYDALGALYQTQLVDPEMAAQSYEEAHLLDSENKARLEKLADIYDADPEGFKEKGIQLQEALLAQNPYRKESYKALRKVYTVARDADASWALCQALSVLKIAEPDEERFYDRMRAETAAVAQQAFTDEDWFQHVAHPSLDPLLTSIFSLIEPAVVKARSQSLQQTGLTEAMRIEDPANHDAPLAQYLSFAADVLGVELPNILANPNDAGGLSYLHTEAPTLAMGQVALSHEVPPQVAAFVAARQLAFTRRGLYLRQFVQTGTALKAWLFAAIKLSSPAFPVASDLEGSVNEALAALKTHLTSDAKDHLASTVSRLIQSGSSLDLKKWFAAVDLTADRAGLIVAHDLATATEVAKATQEQGAAVDGDDRFRELVIFSTSHSYLEMRRQLGVTVEG